MESPTPAAVLDLPPGPNNPRNSEGSFIALFYVRKNSEENCIPQLRYSSDEAATWTDPIPVITDRQGYFVLNNDRVI